LDLNDKTLVKFDIFAALSGKYDRGGFLTPQNADKLSNHLNNLIQ